MKSAKENKYQEAFYLIDGYLPSDLRDVREAKKVIKELIDNCEHLERALDRACGDLESYDQAKDEEEGGGYETKEQWKEWLLKITEEEK